MSGGPKKLVLGVIDALKPEMLDKAVAAGRAPALATLIERGVFVRDCVSTFPSLTPVAAASIGTGLAPDEHNIPSMNWFNRGERRYVEYGSSFSASQAFGVRRSLYDTVYNLNLAHLTRERRTVFEHLDDAGLRTAGTTYLIYRGRHRHQPTAEAGVYSRIAKAAQFRHAVWGPTELFYADLFSSRDTPCRSALGLPGNRDQHTACVGAHLVEHDLFDFLLFSLPDNDTYSHKRGPYAQVTSIASADRALERIMHVAGGVDQFLEDHAVIVMSDHSQTAVEDQVSLHGVFGDLKVLAPAEQPGAADIAVCPTSRFASVYVLDPERHAELTPQVAERLLKVDGVDLCARLTEDRAEAIIETPRGELRFSPGGELGDQRGGAWSVEGDHRALALRVEDGRVLSRAYPDALARLWAALCCRNSGDVLASAAPGYEFVDWGGAAHIGGGSHGSLHRHDSLGALLFSGTGPDSAKAKEQWAIQDVVPMVLDHFGVPAAELA